MASWAALNVAGGASRDHLAQARATEEAQDADNAAMYERALRAQQQHQTTQAKRLYLTLLTGHFRVSPRLEYLCNKNIATMEQEAQSFEHALDFFAAALALDATDVVVWYQMATCAVETGKWWLARRTLEEGLCVDATYWPLVETLAQVLHHIGDEEAYESVAQYLREKDPNCVTLKILDGHKKRARPLSAREWTGRRRVLTKLQHFKDIAVSEGQKRRELQRERKEALEIKRQSRRYALYEASWTRLGLVLLEIYEELDRNEDVDVMQIDVEISVGFQQEERRHEEDREKNRTESTVDLSLKGCAEADVVHKIVSPVLAPVLDTCLMPGMSDNDTQDSNVGGFDLMAFQPKRRKSRRHEERLREEHAAAVKKAREVDLAYQLKAFLPDVVTRKEEDACTLFQWLPPLNVTLVGTEFRVSDADGVTLSTTPSFVLASRTQPPSSQARLQDQPVATAPSRVDCVTSTQLLTFLDAAGDASRRRLGDWMRCYLNQCGQWSHLKLGTDGDDLYQVCLWLEKALNGELNAAHATRPMQASVITVTDHAVRHSSRLQGTGLSLGAQLFLLEMHFDWCLQQPVRGQRRRRQRRVVDTLRGQAQKLLFEFGWREEVNESTSCPSEIEFLRLLWLMARMDERDGRPQRAQQSFMQCRDKFCQLQAVKDDSDAAFCVALPNLKADQVITLAILDEKLSGLRFSDVCSEARRLFHEQKHDQVVLILYDHLFPSLQRPRMTDLLHDFSVDGDHALSQKGDKSKKLIDLLLDSMEQSCQFSNTDRVMFLLTTLCSVLAFLDETSWLQGGNTAHDLFDTVSLRALAVLDYLLEQLTYNKCEQVRDRDHRLVLCGLSVKCLQPSILLRFHSPKDFLSLVRIVLHNAAFQESACSIERTIEVEALAQLLYDIQSLSSEEVRQIAAVMPLAAKKKQPRWDRIRVVVVELLRYLNLTFQSDRPLACSFSPLKRSALMTLCGRLMKEEEETIARSETKISKQLFGNGAILFLLLFESFGTISDETTVLARLVDLIHLLHDRLGQHGICSARYLSDTGAASDTQCRSCFLDTCSALLSTFLPLHDNSRNKLSLTTRGAANAVDDRQQEVEGRFQMEVCQCYRCLYDVQILPGCDDHKSETTFASLQTSLLPVKHDDALRLARFAVPILLTTKPKNNGQKKERLKLLYALRDALADSQFAALSARPPSVFSLLEAYLAPRGLLQEDVRPPSLSEIDSSRVMSPDERCLSHLWYLLGANFILGRVKRRGNLSELTEMEQHVRERLEFLVKDVLYFHPERIDSWLRLGKTMKELYHAATDAFAAVLGRQERIQALLWYTSTILATNATHLSIQSSHEATDSSLFSCSNSIKGWDLFTRMKEWQDQTTNGHNVVEGGSEGAFKDPCVSHASPIATFALTYIMQLIEFAKRCFEMAAYLATKAARNYKADLDRKCVENDLEVNEVNSIIIECNEECGLLLYTLLQEFSLMKEIDRTLFPRDFYSRIVLMAFTYFQTGFDLCELDTTAYETHFRLMYMMGKTLKKKRWCELCFHEVADQEAYASAEEIATCFAKAEDARRQGDREHALVHAFYALQALRIDLTLREVPSTSALRLVCRTFYLDEQDEKRGGDGTSNSQKTMVSSALIDNVNRKEQDDTSRSSSRRDEIVALLLNAERDDAMYEVNVMLAQGWLALNIIEALDSIPDEDRYFHPSRYVLARLVYWLSSYYVTLDHSEVKCNGRHALLEAIQARRSLDKIVGPSDAAARALKEMAPLFDKRRPQIVTIWFSEYIPTAKKFEELNQRQMKYDYYRLKYWRFYIALLEENGAYGRLKEMGSWVLACKEEHDVIELMLVIVVEARGKLLRRRVQEMILTVDPPSADETRDRLCKLLAKTYTYYLEVETAHQRLTHKVGYCRVVTNAELLLVAVYSIKAVTYPTALLVSEDKAASMASNLNSNVPLIVNALLRNEGPPRVYDAHNRDAWKLYVDAARFFCEETWPERSGKGKPLKKLARGKTAACVDAKSLASGVVSSQGAKMDSNRTP